MHNNSRIQPSEQQQLLWNNQKMSSMKPRVETAGALSAQSWKKCVAWKGREQALSTRNESRYPLIINAQWRIAGFDFLVGPICPWQFQTENGRSSQSPWKVLSTSERLSRRSAREATIAQEMRF